MICMICGKTFVSVGVHVKHKHGVTADEYRSEFGLMKTTPLVDRELSSHLSKMAVITFKARSKQEQDEIRARCVANNKISGAGEMSQAAKDKLARRNELSSKKYLTERASIVVPMLDANLPLTDIQRLTGVAPETIKNMAAKELVKYDRAAMAKVRQQRALKTVAGKRDKAIQKIISMYDQDLSLNEICRRAGVGYTSYKRWIADGIIPKRATYMALNFPTEPRKPA